MTIKYDYKEGLYVRYWTDVTVTVFSPRVDFHPLITNISIPYEQWGDDVELALANAAWVVYCAAWFKPLCKVPFDGLTPMQKINFAKLLTDEHWGEMWEQDRDDICRWMFKPDSTKETMYLADPEVSLIYDTYDKDLQQSMNDWFLDLEPLHTQGDA
jgi:hypothetical protein